MRMLFSLLMIAMVYIIEVIIECLGGRIPSESISKFERNNGRSWRSEDAIELESICKGVLQSAEIFGTT